MKLSDYLISQQLGPAEFARRIGVGRMSIHRYIRGERFPRPEVLQRIYQATAGQVTPNDFLALNPTHAPGNVPSNFEARAESAGLSQDSAQCLSDDEELIGRPLYPWSRLQADEQQVLDDAYHDMMDQPPEGIELSPTVQTALETLGNRATCRGDEFTLDGKVTRIVRLIEEANTLRAEQNLPPLRYPGIQI
ncbi:MAG: helix-turn-helix transcriptional regulator [Planctomycetota bacterium]